MAEMYPRRVVLARNVDRQIVGELEYTDVNLDLRFNDIGGWDLVAPAASMAATLLTETGGIVVRQNDGDGRGLRTIFSGPVTSFSLDDATLTVAGASDEIILAEKLATPDPTHTGQVGDAFATEQDIREGTASTIMLDYVRANAVTGYAVGDRAVPGLALGPDPGVGLSVRGVAKFPSLLALLQELALAGGGLRFQLLQSNEDDATLVLTISEPADLTTTVVLSRGRGTLADWKRTVTRPGVSHVYVLGQGQGINQLVVQAADGDLARKYGHAIEGLVARPDTADVLALQQEAATTLADSGEDTVVAFTTVDTPSFRWGREYDLGAIVSVLGADGTIFPNVIRGVNVTLRAPEGDTAATVQAVVSTPGDTSDDPSSRQRRAVSRRVSRLETGLNGLSSVVANQWNLADIRPTLRGSAAPGWKLCDGSAISRVTYAALFGVIGTTYGAGDGSTTFNLPDFRGRVIIGVGPGFALGATGGAATVDASHLHLAGTLAGPSHLHLAGTLAGPSHQHTTPAHQHAAGTLNGPLHNHPASGSGGTLTVPNHQHAAGGSLLGPSHDHGPGTYILPSGSGTTGTATSVANVANAPALAGTNPGHVHNFPSTNISITGNSTTGGTGAVTGTTATDGTATVTGSTANGGNTSVTGLTQFDGSSTSGFEGTGAVTGSTASGGTGAVTGSTATGGSSTLAILPPYGVANIEIYASV